MTVRSQVLASGSGWRAEDVVCTAGPRDRPFEEQHDTICIAAVTEGTFQYRSAQGSATLAPGTLMLGNVGQGFECGHDHGVGDRCLSFHFTPEFVEGVLADLPGARRIDFPVPRLPPLPRLIPIVAAAEAARHDGDSGGFEELALRLVAGTADALAEADGSASAPSRRDARRVTAVLRWMEAEVEEPLSLAECARTAAMSPYHFLRTFRAVVGTTPHQFLLNRRLHRAAVRLRRSDETISAIAFECGFNDLSTFNRQFRRAIGLSPGTYRRH